MAERSNAAVLKTVDPKGPGVRIPLSPQSKKQMARVAGLFVRADRVKLALQRGREDNKAIAFCFFFLAPDGITAGYPSLSPCPKYFGVYQNPSN